METTHEADVEPQVPGRCVRISKEVPELLEAQLIFHGLKTRGVLASIVQGVRTNTTHIDEGVHGVEGHPVLGRDRVHRVRGLLLLAVATPVQIPDWLRAGLVTTLLTSDWRRAGGRGRSCAAPGARGWGQCRPARPAAPPAPLQQRL